MSGEVVKELDTNLFRYPFSNAKSKPNDDLLFCDKDTALCDAPGKVLALDGSYRHILQ